MPRNTSVTLGEHFSEFVDNKIETGRFESVSEAVRAGLRLLEADEAKLDILKTTLAEGKAQLDRGEGVDGEEFMQSLVGQYE
ncbi:type II toxin-antitoxin system ParD family antitoxin [SAR92 clade bacterium H246]